MNRLVGGVSVDHERGRPSTASIQVDRGLKTGRLDIVPLDEDDLLHLVIEAATALQILRRQTA